MSHDGEVTEIGDGTAEPSGSQVTVEPTPAQHRNSLDIDEVWSSQVALGSEHRSRCGTVCSVIAKGIGNN
jgi:hypothetical protein